MQAWAQFAQLSRRVKEYQPEARRARETLFGQGAALALPHLAYYDTLRSWQDGNLDWWLSELGWPEINPESVRDMPHLDALLDGALTRVYPHSGRSSLLIPFPHKPVRLWYIPLSDAQPWRTGLQGTDGSVYAGVTPSIALINILGRAVIYPDEMTPDPIYVEQRPVGDGVTDDTAAIQHLVTGRKE